MIPHHRFEEYKSALMLAQDLARANDCKYYVYDMTDRTGTLLRGEWREVGK